MAHRLQDDREFELRLDSRKVVRFAGKCGEDAAIRYVDCHREATVVAWREVRHGLFIGTPHD